jgi:hypothetical protein
MTATVPSVVRKSQLARLPLEELIAMHKENVAGGPLASWAAPPLRQVVERSDVLIHAKVVEVVPNRDEIINQIVESKGMVNKILCREYGAGEPIIRVNLRLEVFKSYPPMEVRELTAVRRSHVGDLYYIKKGYEGIFALRRLGGQRSRLYNIAVEHGSIYLIHRERGVVSGMPSAVEAGPLDEAWEYMCDLYDSIHGDEQAKSAVVKKALAIVKSSDELAECFAALRLLQSSPKVTVRPGELMDAIERFCGSIKSKAGRGEIVKSQEREAYRGFVALGLKTLEKVGDEGSAERMWALCVEDLKEELSVFRGEDYFIFGQVVRLVLRFPGASRRQQLEQLFMARTDAEYERIRTWEGLQKKHLIQPVHSAVRALARDYSEDVEALLLEMCYHPRRFGIYDSRTLAVVWEALANRGNDKIRPYLKEFLSAPGETEAGVVQYPNVESTIARARKLLDD